MKNSFLTTTLVPILGTIITAFQITREEWACIVFILAAILYSFYLLLRRKKLIKQNKIAGIICILLMAFSSINGLVCSTLQKYRSDKWSTALRLNENPEHRYLLQQSEINDGLSQMKLSDYYYKKNDFKHSREYAQMAATKGSIKGYERLIMLDYCGLGGKKDYQAAFSNIIKVQKLGYSRYDIGDLEFIEELSDLDLSIWEETTHNQIRIYQIEEELAEAINRNGRMMDAKNVFEKYHDELYSLSLNEFLPASECLFLEAWLLNNTKQCKEYASQLYKAGRIPNSPTLRHHVLTYAGRGGNYRLSDYVKHITDNDYLWLVTFDDNESPSKRYFYSDTLLIQEYQLFKAQYQWCLDLNDSKSNIDKIEYFVHTDGSPSTLLARSIILLERNIKAIKLRARHLGEIEPQEQHTDIEISGFKTNFY